MVSSVHQDGALAHTTRVTQDWLKSNYSDFITKDEWPPIHPISIHPTSRLGQCWSLAYAAAKAKTIPELKDGL